MAPILDPKFCSRCGAPMTRAVPPTDSRERHVCSKCGWIHYLDPKVACGTIAELDGKFALIQRNIDPRKGFWSFPCGFMEIDETTEQAALRETKEETGLDVELEGHLGTYSYSDNFYGGAIVVVVYRARVRGGTLHADDDCCDARLIAPAEIPWDQLAFKSSVSALHDWLRHKGLSLPKQGLAKAAVQLRGWIAATENPHHALSSTDGRLEIRDVPPGTWTLRVGHERLGERRIEIAVLPGRTIDLGALHFP